MPTEHHDVIIVGAGISGIGAACHLSEHAPQKEYTVLEAREDLGGTWDLFRYPGIRSDSDMHTLGYSFEPWTETESLADGPAIKQYLRDTAQKHGVAQKIRYGQRVLRSEWSTEDARWTVTVEHGGESSVMTCDFLFVCTGYYDYAGGYTPDFEGTERFKGEVVHPQHWPEDLDYAGKRVVVIGSGATAVTLVPAMADTAAHVTMLQRSPTYIAPIPGEDKLAKLAKRLLPTMLAYKVVRWKNVMRMMFIFQLSRRRPNFVRKMVRKAVEPLLPDGFDAQKHLTPSYDPWDQRMCAVPDGDLFRALRHGKASIVTDHIKSFTEKGIELESGDVLEADIIITATGLNLQLFGGSEVVVDGSPVVLKDKMTYKSMMLSDVPNFAFTMGYTNASWTLKCDLTSEWVCRLLNYMDDHGYEIAVAPRDASVPSEPVIDFSSGYVLRSLDELPKQGTRHPWRLHMNYARDMVAIRRDELADGTLSFSSSRPAEADAGEREPALAPAS